MSRNDWVLNLAVGVSVLVVTVGCLLLAHLLAERPPSFSLIDAECQEAQEQYYRAERQVFSEQNQPPFDQKEHANYERNHADVCAQHRMANAAEAGLWLLFSTLLFSAAAAIAAWLTLRTMRDTAERQLRGYVSLKPSRLFNFGTDQPLRIEFNIHNHGQTPVFEMNHLFEISILEEPIRDGHQFPVPATKIAFNQSVFPNGNIAVWVNDDAPLTAKQVAAIEAGTQNLHVWGVTTYRDAFAAFRKTIVQVSLDLPTFLADRERMRIGLPSPGFNWAYGDRHNHTE